MSLYQKYRPQSFDDVVGNVQAIKALKTLLDKPDHPHVYLFSGDAGCGKTTLARIMAKSLNAEVIEYNSSNTRGIDTAREIIENIQYAPMDGKPLFYILDEVHKSTSDYMNAMLKPLEDYPKHAYFALCTTNPEKILPALKTRCTQISLSPLNEDDMLKLLRRVVKAEGKKLSGMAYETIIENSDGSPRKALVSLESILYLDNEDDILIAIEKTSSSATIDLCRALLNEDLDWQDIAKIITGLETTDWESVRHAVLGYMGAVVLKNPRKRAIHAIEHFSEPFYNTNKAGLVLACYKTLGR